MKSRIYGGTSVSVSAPPVLVVVVHGDLPDPPPSYQYEFARVLAADSRHPLGLRSGPRHLHHGFTRLWSIGLRQHEYRTARGVRIVRLERDLLQHRDGLVRVGANEVPESLNPQIEIRKVAIGKPERRGRGRHRRDRRAQRRWRRR